MKKTIIFCILVLSVLEASAQITQDNVKKSTFDSLQYVSPGFVSGMVYFNDGSLERGALNIDAIRQTVNFINENGEVRELANNSDVNKVAIGKRVFIRFGIDYVELISLNDKGIGLGRLKSISVIEQEKRGAFGMVSETTSIKQIGGVYSEGQFYDFKEDAMVPYIQKIIPFIYRDGKFSRATRRTVEKAFPDKKKEIAKYLEDNDVDFENYSDVEAMFNEILMK